MGKPIESPAKARIPSVRYSDDEPGLPRGYSPRLANEDLIPLKDQHWNAYNIFAFWMSDRA